MVYFALKYLDLIGATVLLGTGAGIAFFMLMAHRTGEAAQLQRSPGSWLLPFLFTATVVVTQPITGIAVAWHVGYSLTDGWIVLSICSYRDRFLLASRRLDADAHGGFGGSRGEQVKRFHRLIHACSGPGRVRLPAFAAVLGILLADDHAVGLCLFP